MRIGPSRGRSADKQRIAAATPPYALDGARPAPGTSCPDRLRRGSGTLSPASLHAAGPPLGTRARREIALHARYGQTDHAIMAYQIRASGTTNKQTLD